MSAALSGRENPLERYWHGHGPLWEVFWVYGVVASAGLAAIFVFALLHRIAWLEPVMMGTFAVYTVWIVVSVWRCAPNVGDERLVPIARALTIAWALNTIFVIVFMLVDLFVTPALQH